MSGKRQFMDCRTCADVGYHTGVDGCLNLIAQQGDGSVVSGFRDAIADALATGDADWSPSPFAREDAPEQAKMILAMPEMQAVREFLLEVAIDNGATDGHDSIWRLRDGRRVPESVIEWVLS